MNTGRNAKVDAYMAQARSPPPPVSDFFWGDRMAGKMRDPPPAIHGQIQQSYQNNYQNAPQNTYQSDPSATLYQAPAQNPNMYQNYNAQQNYPIQNAPNMVPQPPPTLQGARFSRIKTDIRMHEDPDRDSKQQAALQWKEGIAAQIQDKKNREAWEKQRDELEDSMRNAKLFREEEYHNATTPFPPHLKPTARIEQRPDLGPIPDHDEMRKAYSSYQDQNARPPPGTLIPRASIKRQAATAVALPVIIAEPIVHKPTNFARGRLVVDKVHVVEKKAVVRAPPAPRELPPIQAPVRAAPKARAPPTAPPVRKAATPVKKVNPATAVTEKLKESERPIRERAPVEEARVPVQEFKSSQKPILNPTVKPYQVMIFLTFRGL